MAQLSTYHVLDSTPYVNSVSCETLPYSTSMTTLSSMS